MLQYESIRISQEFDVASIKSVLFDSSKVLLLQLILNHIDQLYYPHLVHSTSFFPNSHHTNDSREAYSILFHLAFLCSLS